MGSPSEFQAVVLAGGKGSQFVHLTAEKAKCLLPIGNYPMIWYPLNMLHKMGFQEVIVVCLEHTKSELSALPKKFGLPDLRLDLVSLPEASDDDDMGTADALRLVHDKLRSPRVMVVSSDLVTDLQIHNLTDLHRVHGSSVTALFTSGRIDFKSVTIPGPKQKPKKERDLVGIDPTTSQLCYLSSDVDLDEFVSIRKCLLQEHPRLAIHTNLTDAHCYIIDRWVIDFLMNEKYISSIKGELIPYLVKKQFSREKGKKSIHEEDTPDPKGILQSQPKDLLSYMPTEPLTEQALQLSSWNDHIGDMSGAYHSRSLRCYAFVMDTGICVRSNNLYAYCELNRMSARLMAAFEKSGQAQEFVNPNSQVDVRSQMDPDCFVGSGAVIAGKTTIKSTIIGHNSKVEEKVKLTNCILMDNVSVKEGCQISGSLLCEGAVIGERCNLTNCIVGKGFQFSAEEKHSSEALVDQSNRMMEI